MNVNKVIETAEGNITFTGTLTEAEADLVIKVGLNVLLQSGTLPFSLSSDDEDATLQ